MGRWLGITKLSMGLPCLVAQGLGDNLAAQLASRGFSGVTKGRIRVQGWTVMVTKYLENIFLLETKAWIVQHEVLSQCNKRLCVFLKGSACSVAASSCRIRRAQVKWGLLPPAFYRLGWFLPLAQDVVAKPGLAFWTKCMVLLKAGVVELFIFVSRGGAAAVV